MGSPKSYFITLWFRILLYVVLITIISYLDGIKQVKMMDSTNIELIPSHNTTSSILEYEVISTETRENNIQYLLIKNGKFYKLSVSVKEGKKYGQGIIRDEDGGVVADLSFEEDELSGFCIIRNEQYQIIFKGMMINGKKKGRCMEFENGKLTFHGYYDDEGVRHELFVEDSHNPGYFYEYSEDGVLLSLCQYMDDYETKNGVCYYFDINKNVRRISCFIKGLECKGYGEFNSDGIFTTYNELGEVVYQGELNHIKSINFKENKNCYVDMDIVNGIKRDSEVIYERDTNKRGYIITKVNGQIVLSSQYKKKNGKVLKHGRSFSFENDHCISECIYYEGNIHNVVREFMHGKENRNIMVEYDNDGNKIYEGEYTGSYIKGFCRDGLGKEYSNGIKIFEGTFRKGYRDGQGTSFVDGYPYYIGEWENNYPHGLGIMVLATSRLLVWKCGYAYDNFQKKALVFDDKE